jgi:hypothetical protein
MRAGEPQVSQEAGAPSTNSVIVSKPSYLELNPSETLLNTPLSKSFLFFAIGFYVVLTAVTREVFQADTPYYILSILDYSGTRDFVFWDSGHLLWRPAIGALLHVTHRLLPSVNITRLLVGIMLSVNWAAGLGCILLLARVVRKFVSSPLAFLTASTLAVSQVFLNYVHTGTSYVPGLFPLLVALDFATSKSEQSSLRDSIAFGAALAVAVLLWLPYILALPALFLFPIIINGFSRESSLYTLRATIVAAVIGLGAYSGVAIKLGLSSAAEVQDWFNSASHSIDHTGGFSRATFGFVRSWFEMGNVGVEFHRFLLHDPYAPVSLASLLFAGTWKLVLTYLFLGAVVLILARGSLRDRRVLLFLLLTFLPVFGFGVKWQGGDMERYIAAFPALLLAGACAMNSGPPILPRILGVVFLSALTIVNLSHDFRWVRNAEDRSLSARLDALGPVPENSYIVFFPADPLYGFVSSASVLDQGHNRPLMASWVVSPGSSHVTEWRQDFASNSLKSWQNGKEVWICRGLLDDVPESRWGWVEKADPLVSWKDIQAFFSRLQTSETRGDFVQIPSTQPNIQLLQGIMAPSK